MTSVKSKTPVSVVVPVFNEKKVIKSFFLALKKALVKRKFEVVAVDDGSTDGSGEVLKKISNIKLIAHDCNRGYGEAIKAGVKKSIFEKVAIIDCDGSYQPLDLVRLLDGFSGQAMVIGRRSGKNSGEPGLKKMTKKILGWLASYLVGKKIEDLNSGLRVFKKKDFFKFYHLLPSGFSLTSTLTMACLVNHLPVKFVPIAYRPRVGRSKINPSREIFNFLMLILTTIVYFNPLKVFAPLSLFFFGLSGLVGLGSFLFLPKMLDTSTVILFVTGFQILSIGILADMISKNNLKQV